MLLLDVDANLHQHHAIGVTSVTRRANRPSCSYAVSCAATQSNGFQPKFKARKSYQKEAILKLQKAYDSILFYSCLFSKAGKIETRRPEPSAENVSCC